MPANGSPQMDRGFVTEQVVYGVTLRYDQAGSIVSPSAGTQSDGPFSQVSIRWNKASETDQPVKFVTTPGDKVYIVVENFVYKINPADGTFKRTPANENGKEGLVSELRIRDDRNNDGEKTVVDIYQASAADDNMAFIITRDNPTCRYRLNQATRQWERVCRG
jgi:hypothetical protein